MTTALLGDCPPLFEQGLAVAPLLAVLNQLAELIDSITDEQYAQKPVGVMAASVGGHVRHNLDHITALLHGIRLGQINYDHRDRGTAVETDRQAARALIADLSQELQEFPWLDAPDSLPLLAIVAPDLPPVEAVTTTERELIFVLSHTIHHNALIAVTARLLGAAVPSTFGYAPSTLAHQRSRTCAR